MSRQTLCLSVGKFFSQCHWQGYIQRLEQQLHNQALSRAVGIPAPGDRQRSWQCSSVQDFFNLYDWQGYSAEPGHPVKDAAEPSLADVAGIEVPQLNRGRSWQCLAVEDFFSRYDWEAQPLQWQAEPPRETEAAPELLPPDPLKCLPVEDFFGRCHWQGHQSVPETLPNAVESSPLSELASELATSYQPQSHSESLDWQCLSVKDFFGKSNWTGRQILRQRQRVRSRSNSPLILPMGEFFALFLWEGQPEVATSPKTKSVPFAPARSQDFNLASLSELF